MQKLKKTLLYFINIIICLFIFFISLKISNVYPFGDISIGKSDAFVQFKPMLYNMITKLKEGILTNYSFNNGLGNPTIFNILYYLSSPLNFIALFFKSANAMYLSVITIKIILTTIFMTYYTKKKINNNFFITIVTTTYVFSSWFITYYYYIPWLDIFMIFPLFNYGLEKMMKENNSYLYIFTLSYIIITNFYLAFPICIYTIFYFIFYILYNKCTKKDILKHFNKVFLSTMVIFLLTFCHLYILYKSYLKMDLSFSTLSLQYTSNFSSFISSLFYGNTDFISETSGQTFPNLAVNTFALMNIFFYFFNSNISKREKIYSFIIIIICILPIFLTLFDFILNFFHNINGLTFRYIFIQIFLSILLFIRNIQTFNPKDLKKFYITSLIILILLIISHNNMDYEVFILNLTYLICFNILIFFYSKNKLYKLLFFLTLISQTILVTSNNITLEEITIADEDLPNYFNTKTTTYRQNTVTNNTTEYLNYNLYSNTNVTYLLSSMSYNSVIDTLGKLGCNYGDNILSCSDNNTLVSMLFNVKNDYYLEKIYSVNKEILNIDLDPYNTKNSLEYLITATTQITDIFDKIVLTGEESDGKYYFTTSYPYYLIDDKDLNYPLTSQEFYISTELSSSNQATIYVLNENKLQEIYNVLKQNQINYTHYEDNYIEGTITTEENQVIFTSIPYDEDWIITIDDEVVKPTKVLDSLMAIECSAGNHTIKLKYSPNYTIPLIISIITFISIIISIIKKKISFNNLNTYDKNIQKEK